MCLISVSNKSDLVKHSFISSNLFIYYCITFPLHSINGYLVNSWNLASCQSHMVTAEQNDKEYSIKNNNTHTQTSGPYHLLSRWNQVTISGCAQSLELVSLNHLLFTKFRTGQSGPPSLYQVSNWSVWITFSLPSFELVSLDNLLFTKF